jgi:ATP-dependent DNA helicase RecQ
LHSNIHEILKRTFGYDAFRPGQEAIIESVLNGNDTLALMPTGGGKSVCFQVPVLAMDGVCLVITPLIALMKDQVQQLRKRNVPALAIYSGMPFFEVKKALENACTGHFKFLYISPERLQTSLFKEYLPGMPVNLVAIDEAHCISQWGYDFRPAYLKIAELRDELPHVPLLALTASATLKVQKDITEKLHFSLTQKIFRQSFERPSLSFSAFEESNKMAKLLHILQQVPGSALVYCRSRKRTVEIADQLMLHGMQASFYHAGLSGDERNRRQDAWLKGDTRVMCCTNAFGMGIDKADVRCVVHYDLPDSLEAYYQEAGRAGRDGKRSYAVLLFTKSDLEALRHLPAQKFMPINRIREVYQQVANFLQLPVGAGAGQYFSFDLAKFCEAFKQEPPQVLNALQALQTAGYLQFSEQVFVPSTVHVVANRNYMEQVEHDYPHLEPLIKLLLRTYEGILDFAVSVREKTLAKVLHCSEAEVVKGLKQLAVYQVLEYQPLKEDPQVYFLYDRVVATDVVIDEQLYHHRKLHYQMQVEAMAGYAANTTACRSQIVRHYFGDTSGTDCGICDWCLHQKRKAPGAVELKAAIMHLQTLLSRPQGILQLRRLSLQFPAATFDAAFQVLVEEEQVVQLPDGNYALSR